MKAGYLGRFLICVVTYYSGILWLVRTLRRWQGKRRILLLTYHSFSESIRYLDMAVPPSLFLKQVQYVRKVFKVCTLSGLLDAWGSLHDLQDDLAVITVDDGYADNFEPLVSAATELGVPSTLFVTTSCVDTAEPTPVMSVMLAVHFALAESIDLSDMGLGSVPIKTPMEKEIAIRKIDAFLKPLQAHRRSEVINSLMEKTGRRDVVRPLARTAMLRWDQIKDMHSVGVEIGAHSLTHPMLSCLDPSAARHEIVASIQRVKDMIGVETVTFAYPYGGQADVSDVVVDICRISGARGAVMLLHGEVQGSDCFRIPRKMVTSDLSTNPWGYPSKAMWACELEGIVDHFRKLLGSVQAFWGCPGR